MGTLLDTFADLQTDLRSRIQETTASLRTDADLKLWLNLALRRFAERTRYFEVDVSGATVASTGTYALTSGTFILTRWIDFLGVRQVTYNGVLITQAKERDLPVLRNTTTTGTPAQWFVYKKILELYPIPSGTSTLRVYAWQYPAEMSAGTDTSGLPVSKNELLVLGAMAACLEKDEHPDAPYYRQQEQALTQEFLDQWEEGQNRHRQEGFYLDPVYYSHFRFGT